MYMDSNKESRDFYGEAVELINGGGDLEKLRLGHCKAYLRKHALKVSGSKADLLKRIGGYLQEKQNATLHSPSKEIERDSYPTLTKVANDAEGLEKFKVEDCKAYLHKHGLRLTGSKLILLERIRQYLKLKDGSGQDRYPPSTFTIDCTGDACIGDIVLFRQIIYDKYDIKVRGSLLPPLGKRIVAGRIVTESYGAKKQQHTFTMEVLWSTGVKNLPPLYPLTIKGRNLYRLRTYRQCWSNEEARRRVIQEKHIRGAAARDARSERIDRKKHHRSYYGTKRVKMAIGHFRKGGKNKRKTQIVSGGQVQIGKDSRKPSTSRTGITGTPEQKKMVTQINTQNTCKKQFKRKQKKRNNGNAKTYGQ